jgi:hypothetical protein
MQKAALTLSWPFENSAARSHVLPLGISIASADPTPSLKTKIKTNGLIAVQAPLGSNPDGLTD